MIYAIIWMHWLSDFILQTDKMARNKSKSNCWLVFHISVYTIPFFLFGWKFALFNGATHFVVDWLTSRATSRLWAKQEVHNFFVVIGFDQAVHLSLLIWSAKYFGVI